MKRHVWDTSDGEPPTFRVRDTGQILRCSGKPECYEATTASEHGPGCSIKRHMVKAARRAEQITRAAAAKAAETGFIPR